jgi:hypothetical protein
MWMHGCILKRRSRVGGCRAQRALVEEAQVAVECFSEMEMDYDKLEGRWLLLYTTARDVVSGLGRWPGPHLNQTKRQCL